MTKILAGASVRQDPEVFRAYLKSLLWQKLPPDTTVDYLFVDDNDDKTLLIDQTKEAGESITIVPAAPRPDDAIYDVGEQTHVWQTPTFHHLAANKQQILDHAVECHYDYIFMVDTDLILEPTVLRTLLSLDVDVANAVFWTPWNQGLEPLPQCWLRHPYELDGMGLKADAYLKLLVDRQLVHVAGGGACTLIRTQALSDRLSYSPLLSYLPEGGMWKGEDRSFAVRAQKAHVEQWADGWPDIYHAYHPQDRVLSALEEALRVLGAPRQLRAAYGDSVAFRLAPLEHKDLVEQLHPSVQNIRGRLGAIKMLPTIEAALMEMEPGQKRLIDVHYPRWWPIQQVAGKKALMEIHLVDIKPYGAAPFINKEVYHGIDLD